MARRKFIIPAITAVFLGGMAAFPSPQQRAVRAVDEKLLSAYAGVYQWPGSGFLYLQIWNELSGKNELVAFDESGEVRTLYPTADNRFFAGPGAAVPTAIESRIEFHRDGNGRISALTWEREGAAPRKARRVEIESREEVRFPSGN